MVGVSSPLFSVGRRQGSLFLVGYVFGNFAAGTLLLVLILPISTIAKAEMSLESRVVILGAILGLLGALDLMNRTPHLARQTPQRFARELRPGPLGFVYGLDVGLILTTQRASSLPWALLFGTVLVASEIESIVAIYAFGLVQSAAVSVQATLGRPMPWKGWADVSVAVMLRGARMTSGALLLGVGILGVAGRGGLW